MLIFYITMSYKVLLWASIDLHLTCLYYITKLQRCTSFIILCFNFLILYSFKNIQWCFRSEKSYIWCITKNQVAPPPYTVTSIKNYSCLLGFGLSFDIFQNTTYCFKIQNGFFLTESLLLTGDARLKLPRWVDFLSQ